MSTRSRIGIQHADGYITSIYTHNDGYPSHHAPILRQHYATAEKLLPLLALGDLSVLGTELGEKHDFDDRNPDWCKAYARDRNESGTQPAKSHSVAQFNDRAWLCDADYRYLFRNGEWSYSRAPINRRDGVTWLNLADFKDQP